jgi:hypothetical protein
VLNAFVGVVYISAGANIRLTPQWDLGLGFVGAGRDTYYGNEGEVGASTQFAFSLSAVRRFHRPGTRSGVFVAPKLIFTITNVGSESCWDCGAQGRAPGATPAYTMSDFQLGLELGYRFVFAHWALSLMLPSASIGFTTNVRAEPMETQDWVATSLTGIGGVPPGRIRPSYGIDLTLIRFAAVF